MYLKNLELDDEKVTACDKLSRPTLSQGLMLSVTKFKLDLISDVDMYLFLKKVWKMVFLIFLKDTAKATNKYLKSYDPKKPTIY